MASNASILYVDDDAENLLGFESSFSREFRVFTAEDTDSALSIMRSEQSIGIVLVDYKMPKEDGITFVSRIRDDFFNTVFIIISAWADIDVVLKAMNMNSFYGFIQKPWNHTELEITLKNANELYLSRMEAQKLSQVLELKNAQLVASIKREIEASRVKDIFLQNISHEIRTPLNSIIGFSSLIKTHSQNIEIAKYAQFINQSGFELLSTIQNTIDVSLILTNQVETKCKKFNLKELISSIIETKSGKLQSKNLTVKINISRELHAVNDEFKVEQILNILIDNAIKYTKRGGIEISYIDLDDSILVEVKDTGIGIEATKLSQVFESFRQSDESLTRAYTGSGMGLFIAKSYARILGGDITVKSIPGQGSSFYLKLKKSITHS